MGEIYGRTRRGGMF